MNQEKIDRINELARKNKLSGLTDDELKERELLRKEYLMDIRRNLSSQLDSIKVKEQDGSIHKLRKKNG